MELQSDLLERVTQWIEYLDSDPPIDNNEDFCRLKSNRPNWSWSMCGVYWKFAVELTGEAFSEEPSTVVERAIKEATLQAIANSSYLQDIANDSVSCKVVKADTREPISTLAERILAQKHCSILFDGWKDDSREIAEIPKARKYLKSLLEEYPEIYHKFDVESQFVVMASWCEAKPVQRSMQDRTVDWAFDDAKQLSFFALVNQC